MFVSLFNKAAALHACNFTIKRVQHRHFPVKFVKFVRTPILKNICERLLLSSVNFEIMNWAEKCKCTRMKFSSKDFSSGTRLNTNTFIKIQPKYTKRWKQNSAIKLLLETLLFAIKMCTGFTIDVIWVNTKVWSVKDLPVLLTTEWRTSQKWSPSNC